MELQNIFRLTTLTFLELKLTLRSTFNNLIIIERELPICTSRDLYGGSSFTRLQATWKMYSGVVLTFFVLGLSHKEAAPLDSRDRSNEKNPGCLVFCICIGDYTQLCGDYNKP